ncbi:helix-turn-helix domain-containing protein [Candidatus Uabimicrobium amorphum]|uniref:Transcriptional regulator n=1 Tax=Uabimicrobium amorphum TaxID=2596890 RepID=A0A5S9IRT7_UABAM|nr:helix-turn-helix domain-containing protein [Candidatus Uabimicrobium amorphum]BBM86929.1 transcriptional regulator [Candidatus Uabimicrobium amorphum]
MNLKHLGLRIKRQREKQKLRQIDIANALHVSSQAVSKWERGENAPDISLLVELARLLDISVEWLLVGEFPEADTFDATIFCTSLNGFAEKSKTTHPRDLATEMNSLFFTITEIVLKHNGVPVKYVGDGFLAFFTGENSRTNAIDAAIRSRKLTGNNDLIVSLHFGAIYLGTIGHPDYSCKDILGKNVNTCFLVLPWIAKNCGSGIGITKPTLDEEHEFTYCGKLTTVAGLEQEVFQVDYS